MGIASRQKAFNTSLSNILGGMEQMEKTNYEEEKAKRARALANKNMANSTAFELSKLGVDTSAPEVTAGLNKVAETGSFEGSGLTSIMSNVHRQDKERATKKADLELAGLSADTSLKQTEEMDTYRPYGRRQKGIEKEGEFGISERGEETKMARNLTEGQVKHQQKLTQDVEKEKLGRGSKRLADKRAFAQEQKGWKQKPFYNNLYKKATGKGAAGALDKAGFKRWDKEIGGAGKLRDHIETVDVTIDALDRFIKGDVTGLGTGPLQQYLVPPLFSSDAELLDKMYKQLELDVMKKTFEGMAKAIDSDAERAFFHASNPGRGTREGNALSMLLAKKSFALKQQKEIEDKQAHARAGGTPSNYKSRVLNNSYTSMVSKNTGQMILVPKEKAGEAAQLDMVPIDIYADYKYGSKGSDPEKEKRIIQLRSMNERRKELEMKKAATFGGR